MRRAFFFNAAIFLALVILLEIGAAALIGLGESDDMKLGIPALASLDLLIPVPIALMALALLGRHPLQARLTMPLNLGAGIVGLIAAVAVTFEAFGKLILMVALFTSPPFGTAAYLSAFKKFPQAEAGAVLLVLMLLKIGVIAGLVLANAQFLKARGLMLMLATTLCATLAVSFLHGLPPSFLVSITDAIAAIVVGIAAAVWAFKMALTGAAGATQLAR